MRVRPVRPVFTGAGGAVDFDSLRGVFFMSDLKQAAQTALEAWDRSRQWPFPIRPDKEFDALRAALAQPIISPEIKGDKAEPVAYLWQHSETGRTRILEKDQVWTASNPWKRVGPLYLHPPRRQPLTDDQIDKIAEDGLTGYDRFTFARAIEVKHGIEP